MAASFSIYEILVAIEFILCVGMMILIIGPDAATAATWNRIVKLVISLAVPVINLVQIPMEVQMGKSYAMSIIIFIMFFISALLGAFDFGKHSH